MEGPTGQRLFIPSACRLMVPTGMGRQPGQAWPLLGELTSTQATGPGVGSGHIGLGMGGGEDPGSPGVANSVFPIFGMGVTLGLSQRAHTIHSGETEAQRGRASWGRQEPEYRGLHPSPPGPTVPAVLSMPEGMSKLTRGMDSSFSVASARVQGPPTSPGSTPGPSTASTTSP